MSEYENELLTAIDLWAKEAWFKQREPSDDTYYPWQIGELRNLCVYPRKPHAGEIEIYRERAKAAI